MKWRLLVGCRIGGRAAKTIDPASNTCNNRASGIHAVFFGAKYSRSLTNRTAIRTRQISDPNTKIKPEHYLKAINRQVYVKNGNRSTHRLLRAEVERYFAATSLSKVFKPSHFRQKMQRLWNG